MGVSGGDKDREMAERTTILRVPAGSNLHGLALPGRTTATRSASGVEDLNAAVGFSECLNSTSTGRQPSAKGSTTPQASTAIWT